MPRPKTKVTATVRRGIVAGYTRAKNCLGLVALAEKFKLSTAVIHRILAESNVTLRGRGRPRKAG